MFDNGTITQMSPALKTFQTHRNIRQPADYKAMGINEESPVTLINGERSISIIIKPDQKYPVPSPSAI